MREHGYNARGFVQHPAKAREKVRVTLGFEPARKAKFPKPLTIDLQQEIQHFAKRIGWNHLAVHALALETRGPFKEQDVLIRLYRKRSAKQSQNTLVHGLLDAGLMELPASR